MSLRAANCTSAFRVPQRCANYRVLKFVFGTALPRNPTTFELVFARGNSCLPPAILARFWKTRKSPALAATTSRRLFPPKSSNAGWTAKFGRLASRGSTKFAARRPSWPRDSVGLAKGPNSPRCWVHSKARQPAIVRPPISRDHVPKGIPSILIAWCYFRICKRALQPNVSKNSPVHRGRIREPSVLGGIFFKFYRRHEVHGRGGPRNCV